MPLGWPAVLDAPTQASCRQVTAGSSSPQSWARGHPCEALHFQRAGKTSGNPCLLCTPQTLLHTLLISRPLQRLSLNEGIANFYDDSSALWESMWGEHMHHGYYPKGGEPKSNTQAQVDMVEEVLSWAGVKQAAKASPHTTFVPAKPPYMYCLLDQHLPPATGPHWSL